MMAWDCCVCVASWLTLFGCLAELLGLHQDNTCLYTSTGGSDDSDSGSGDCAVYSSAGLRGTLVAWAVGTKVLSAAFFLIAACHFRDASRAGQAQSQMANGDSGGGSGGIELGDLSTSMDTQRLGTQLAVSAVDT